MTTARRSERQILKLDSQASCYGLVQTGSHDRVRVKEGESTFNDSKGPRDQTQSQRKRESESERPAFSSPTHPHPSHLFLQSKVPFSHSRFPTPSVFFSLQPNTLIYPPSLTFPISPTLSCPPPYPPFPSPPAASLSPPPYSPTTTTSNHDGRTRFKRAPPRPDMDQQQKPTITDIRIRFVACPSRLRAPSPGRDCNLIVVIVVFSPISRPQLHAPHHTTETPTMPTLSSTRSQRSVCRFIHRWGCYTDRHYIPITLFTRTPQLYRPHHDSSSNAP